MTTRLALVLVAGVVTEIAVDDALAATTFIGALSGNASSASVLATPRAINGVNFDGSAAITVADATKVALAGDTMTGLLTVSLPADAIMTMADFTNPTVGTASQGLITVSSDTAGLQLGANSSTYAGSSAYGNANEMFVRSTSSASGLYLNASGTGATLRFATASFKRMQIDASGNLTTTGATAKFGGTPYGYLGVREGGAYGGPGPNGVADGIVLEANVSTGVSVLSPSTSTGYFICGDPGSDAAGGMKYSHITDTLSLIAGTASLVAITSTLANFVIPLVSSTTARFSGAVYGELGVREGGAYGGAGPNSLLDGIVLESNTSTGISVLQPNTYIGYLLFGDPEHNAVGGLSYTHSTDTLQLRAGADSDVVAVTAGAVTVNGTLKATGGAGINGKAAVTNIAAPAAASDLATAITLVNSIRSRLISFGLYT